MEELGHLIPPLLWNVTAHWDLTSLLTRILQVNGAPLFDVAVQVDDRNTSRFIISVGLPRQSGVMPSFYSQLPQDLVDLASRMTADEGSASKTEQHSAGIRKKRQFTNFADNPSDNRDETPESLLEALNGLPFHNEAGGPGGLFLPDANFLSSIQVSCPFRTYQLDGIKNNFGAFYSKFRGTRRLQRLSGS